MPVVDYYRERNKVVEIDSSPSVQEVYAQVRAAVEARLPSTAESTYSTTSIETEDTPAQPGGIGLGAVA